MEGRERVRRHLGRGGADRPPLIIFATAFAARLEQVEPNQLWEDANLLTRTLLRVHSLFGADALVIEPPPAALGADGRAIVSDAIGRLRTTTGDAVALVIALPGPLTLASLPGPAPGATLEDLGDELVETLHALGPERADCLAVVERTAVSSGDAELLEEALTPLWNAARYYAVASMLLAAEGVPELGETGADAVAVWTGASPRDLAARGSRHVGVAVEAGQSELPEAVEGGFYISRGELPAATEAESLHRLMEAVRR
jgi:hypothetical protein